MAKYSQGLKKLELAPYTDDTTIGAYEEVGSTGIGTLQLTSEEGDQTPINVEELSQAVVIIYGDSRMNLNWDTLDASNEQLIRFFGGTESGAGTAADPKVYEMPEKIVPKNFRARVTTATDDVLVIGKLSVMPRLNWTFTKDDVGRISLAGNVIAPPAGVKVLTRSVVAVPEENP